jgi:hypothetical protein
MRDGAACASQQFEFLASTPELRVMEKLPAMIELLPPIVLEIRALFGGHKLSGCANQREGYVKSNRVLRRKFHIPPPKGISERTAGS